MPPRDARATRLATWLGGQWALSSPRRTARLLQGFAKTEEQSQLELRRAARVCSDDRRRALYLRHALDEARHARAFAEHAEELMQGAGGEGFARPAARLEGLFERLGEWRFLAFVHQGERRGRVEFETYARLLRRRGRLSSAELFEALVRDEREHEAYSGRLLQELAGSSGARQELRWAARCELFAAFQRRGSALGLALYVLVMSLMYLLLAPYALSYRWLVRPRRGFVNEP